MVVESKFNISWGFEKKRPLRALTVKKAKVPP
jgi:hypothetical protein